MIFRSAAFLLGLSMASLVPATAAPPAAPVDACKMIDAAAVASAAKAWFGKWTSAYWSYQQCLYSSVEIGL
jgi:hypothetical protein